MTWLRCHFSGRHAVTFPLVTALTTLEVCDPWNLEKNSQFLKCFPFGHPPRRVQRSTLIPPGQKRFRSFQRRRPTYCSQRDGGNTRLFLRTAPMWTLDAIFFFIPPDCNDRTTRHTNGFPSKERRTQEIIVSDHFNNCGCAL